MFENQTSLQFYFNCKSLITSCARNMRILVFFVVALAVLENALAQTALASPGALKVQTEAWKILKSFTAKASKEVKAFQSDIQSRVSDYYNEYTRVKGRIETKLNPLGIKGRTVLSAISDDIDALIASLKTQFDSEILSSEIDLVLNSLKSQFIDSLPDEIEWLTDAVFKNKTAIKCWDNNKAAIKMLVENIFQETQKVVKADQTQLGSQVKALVKQMRDGVAKAESEIQSQCKSDQACILKYVR